MNFALSVSLLAQALSRSTQTDAQSQTEPVLLTTLAADEVLTMTLDLEGQDPTRLTVTQLAINGADRRGDLSAQSWTTSNPHIGMPGSVSYQVIQAAGADAPLLISSVFNAAEVPPPAAWGLQATAQGAFEILASVANSPAPGLTNQADGDMLIGA